MKVLVTGGTGYIGSHTCVELLEAGHEAVIVDNLCNSKREVVDDIEAITGKRPIFYEGDVLDRAVLDRIFSEHTIDVVIHFAGLKAVGESVEIPLWYYQNNVMGTVSLCEAMAAHGCKKIVFSSSATVYGEPESSPIPETFPLHALNPYGRTKQVVEMVLTDLFGSDPDWSISLLRYFNPIGAHPSGRIGEDPNGIPNNLMPYITQVAMGKFPHLRVFGDDYKTRDGTGVRDYIHVVDLALGHIKAIDKVMEGPGVSIYNLGTGSGYSVLEIVGAFEKATSVPIPYEIYPRRPGDIAEYYADPAKAKRELGWVAEKSIEDMCADSYNFIRNKSI